MITAQISIGDHFVFVQNVQSLDRNDPLPYHHMIVFRNMVTGKTEEIHCESEVKALGLFTSWINSDLENHELVPEHISCMAILNRSLSGGFLP